VLLRAWRAITIVDMPALVDHAVVGAVAYHDVMARPWPKVAPLDDDAWDD
jgi:hypothetical protein